MPISETLTLLNSSTSLSQEHTHSMDTATSSQQKEFLSSLFPAELAVDIVHRELESQRPTSTPYPFNNGHTSNNAPPLTNSASGPYNLDLLANLNILSGIDKPTTSQLPQYTPQMLLEQQFKLSQLQQLQQLQNQIFQQQIALISRLPDTCPAPEGQREQSVRFHGLPTPGPSTELRAQPSTDYVSPMTLHYMDVPEQGTYPNNDMRDGTSHTSQPSDFYQPRGSTSAPAHIAFHTSPSFPISSPNGELDFDISPLTSPWLGANQHNVSPRPLSNKRTASASDGESADSNPRRKRATCGVRSDAATAVIVKKPTRVSKSTTTTPLIRSSRSRRNGDGMADTPSPVDLTMPPPAPPAAQMTSVLAPSPSPSLQRPMPDPSGDAPLTPVTPASIMNLGRLGLDSSLAPPSQRTSKSNANAKALAKAKAESSAKSKTNKQAPTGSMVSPALKPILPAVSTSAVQVGSFKVVQVRKTSHKAAEQKRRDSLKTTFDDLRVLLPPIPLPSDENFPNEPILPGALPPRGPPKSGTEGPNKGVSKLQLLRCGNDFIRKLKARVDRRDEEIEKLRREIRRLRVLVDPAAAVAGEELDLEHDLDAAEPASDRYCPGSMMVEDEVDEEED